MRQTFLRQLRRRRPQASTDHSHLRPTAALSPSSRGPRHLWTSGHLRHGETETPSTPYPPPPPPTSLCWMPLARALRSHQPVRSSLIWILPSPRLNLSSKTPTRIASRRVGLSSGSTNVLTATPVGWQKKPIQPPSARVEPGPAPRRPHRQGIHQSGVARLRRRGANGRHTMCLAVCLDGGVDDLTPLRWTITFCISRRSKIGERLRIGYLIDTAFWRTLGRRHSGCILLSWDRRRLDGKSEGGWHGWGERRRDDDLRRETHSSKHFSMTRKGSGGHTLLQHTACRYDDDVQEFTLSEQDLTGRRAEYCCKSPLHLDRLLSDVICLFVSVASSIPSMSS